MAEILIYAMSTSFTEEVSVAVDKDDVIALLGDVGASILVRIRQ